MSHDNHVAATLRTIVAEQGPENFERNRGLAMERQLERRSQELENTKAWSWWARSSRWGLFRSSRTECSRAAIIKLARISWS